MKRFLVKFLTLLLAFLLLLAILEYAYAALESDYSYKAEHLNHSENTYETIILGSSHAYYGIDPQAFKNSTFNLAHVSQSLDLDIYLLDKYKKKTNFNTVIIPISYFSFQQSLFESDESWRATDYYYSYGLKTVPLETKLFCSVKRKISFAPFIGLLFLVHPRGDMWMTMVSQKPIIIKAILLWEMLKLQ